MSSLHKFKLLATQCAISDTPTHSPTTSPVFHLRRHRRKTLRMLLSRSNPDHHHHHHRHRQSPPRDLPEKRVRRKLKDLFVSSPPPFDDTESKMKSVDQNENHNNSYNNQVRFPPVTGSIGGGLPARRRVVTSSSTFRYRLLRRAWRPVLISIPEIE